MIEFGGKRLCESCFEEITSQPCPYCGFDPAVSSADPTILAPGSVLLGKYIVGRVIGKGGFGITYLAYDTTLGKKAAIKEFYPYGIALRTLGNPTVSVSTSENASVFKTGAEKFYEEAKLVSRFNGNPNIVAVHEFFYENDTVYFSMEYLSGHTLKDHIQKIGTMNAGQALFIAQNVSNALMVAHSASVLHRDISPDNIMLCDSGEVKLIDFGAARQVIAEHSQTFSVILKPGFAPLEQYQKKGKQGAWTDIYSLGATLYYALTGDIPDDPMSRQEEDETFSENKYNINEELWNVIRKAAMLKIPDRYQDVFEFRKALNQVSFPAEPIAAPKTQDSTPQEGFRTAMPFGTSTATMQRTQNIPAEVSVSAPQAASEKKPGFFAAHKKPIIAAASAAGTAAAAAVILAVALNSGGKPADSYVRSDNSMYSSLPGGISAQEPVVSESEEVKSVLIGGESYSTDLTELILVGKGLKDSDVKDLKYMKNLTYLELSFNDLTDISFVKEMPKLKSLGFINNNVSDISAVKELSELEEITGAQNPVSDISPLSDCTKLRGVWFSDCNIGDSLCALKDLSNLETVNLSNCGIYDISPLAGKKKLTNIYLDKNLISDVSPLKDCERITNLSLGWNPLSESSIDSFAGLTVETLWLNGTELTSLELIHDVKAKLNGETQNIWV